MSNRQNEIDVARTLVILGLVLVAAGFLWPYLGKMGLGLSLLFWLFRR